MNNKPVIIIGAGGHASVVVDVLKANQIVIKGLTCLEPNGQKYGCQLFSDDDVLSFSPQDVDLVMGLGATRPMVERKALYETFKTKGYHFKTIVHPTAYVAPDVKLEQGVQVMAGVIIQPGVQVGENTILNTKASIDHDCNIGAHVHVAPGATLAASITIESLVHIGLGANVVQGLHIGHNSFIYSGVTVTKDIMAHQTKKLNQDGALLSS